jgi:SAM-dependent methyltransferase
VLEVGAGTGVVAAALSAAGYGVAVSDVSPAALEYCRRRGLAERLQFDLLHPALRAGSSSGSPDSGDPIRGTPGVGRPALRNEFDCVAMFDVLEHLADDTAALAAVRTLLRPGGRAIVTVPASTGLWSRADEAARHRRRYGLQGVRRLFEASGFEVLCARGFFLSLLPGLLLRKLLFPAGKSAGPETRRAKIEDRRLSIVDSAAGLAVVPVANELILGILTVERSLTRHCRPVVGASLALVARKR